jgi:hypothetical protein
VQGIEWHERFWEEPNIYAFFLIKIAEFFEEERKLIARLRLPEAPTPPTQTDKATATTEG